MKTVRIRELNGGDEYEVEFHNTESELINVEIFEGIYSGLLKMTLVITEWCSR